MSLASDETVVLVVGAGPTGLLLASELSRRGVPCHLIDAQSAPLHWDRATVVHPRSLQIFESLGLAEKFLAAGCRQRVIKLHSNGELLGTIDLAGCGSVYGFNVGLSEEVTESILTTYLHQHGGQVNRSSRLIGLTINPNNRVLAEIERDGNPYQIEARIDYAHSPIVFGDPNSSLAPGHRALAHCAGNTLILLGGPAANPSSLLALDAALQQFVKDSTLFETAVALSASANQFDQIGHIEATEALRLGIKGSTLLAVRPDGYVGLRSDHDHLAALKNYAASLQTGF